MADSAITFTPGEVSRYYAARVSRLNQRRAAEWRGACPIHDGKDDNFAVDPATGRWFCHSTCGRGGDILELEAALAGGDFPTRKAEVFRLVGRAELEYRHNGTRTNGNSAGSAPTKPTGAAGGWREVARYPYVDRDGNLLFEVVRYLKPDGEKAFRQRRPDGRGGWVWNLEGVKRVPYHLPKLLADRERAVFLAEGEKDVETVEAWGLVASCNPGGSGSSALYGEWTDRFRGRHVFILPDNDEAGRRHAAAVAAALLGAAASIRIVELPGLRPKGDVTDWRDAGGTRERFREIVTAAADGRSLDVAGLSALRSRWGLDSDVDAAAEKPTLRKGVSESSRFRLTDGGVIYIDPDPDKEPLQICGRLEVAALTRDAKGDGWGRLLRWADSEGRPHEWPMPMSLLAGDGNEYRARLLDGGLFLAPGSKARQRLPIYLQTMCPEKRALCVERVGWHGYSFVLPGETIGPEGAEMVLFQTPFETDNYLNVRGSVDEWRENVGRYCVGNSRLILVVSCAFAGPLLSLMGSESGGVHFTGATSTGKSTALLVGGSVLGGGGRNGFVQSWRTTANGLEAVAELHNDLTLFLDELAQMDPHEAAETAYLLGNGSGKTRMSRNIGARKKLSWSLLFVSAGEITLADHVQAAGKRTKGGAEVRLLNIEADSGAGLGLFENIHGAESADVFARQLKNAAGRFYGAPLRAYLKNLTAKRASVETTVRNFQAEFLSRHVPAGASGEVLRAAQRFGLIGAAGELATDAGVTGWKADEAAGAAARCLKSWIAGRGTTGAGDAEAALRQVRRFLEAHGASRFQVIRPGVTDSSNENQIVVNRAGFRQQAPDGETQFLILPETFKSEVCNGFDYRMVARTMKERNLLECQPPDLTKRFRLPGNIGLIRAFCIRSSILEG
jgi:putative DNA primase/helicase